jgi:hypothetical protein
MKRTARFVLAALALSAAPARGQDPQPPAFRLPATAAPVSYDVDLTIDPGQTRLLGKAGIEVRLGEATRVLWLNAREIEIDAASVTFAGTPVGVRAIAGGTEFVGLAFEREIGPGALALRLTYRAAIRENSSQGVFRQKDGDQFYVYTQFETTDARRAIPCFDEPAYKVPWQLTLRIPKGMTAVSNTPVESDAAGADGGRVVRFRKTPPLPSYLIAFGIGPFEYVDAGRAGKKRIPVRIVVPRGKADRTKLAVETTGPLLEKLEDYFSIPFPYDKLDQLVIPQTVTFSAMENPGLITWGEQYLLESPGRASGSMRRFAIFVNAHEIAHQWFGDLVTPTWWDDIWLNESFADWAAHKAVAAWRPDSGSEITELDDLFDALGADSVLAARQLHQPIVTADDIENAFDPISYEKGSAVLTMFESWIGEAKFRKGVRRYLQAHAHKTATSRDFLAAIEAEGIPGAAAAMATFLDQPGVPLIDAALSCDVSGRPRLTLSQTRYLPIGSPRPAPQIWHVPVCARDSGGKASDSVSSSRAAPARTGRSCGRGAPATIGCDTRRAWRRGSPRSKALCPSSIAGSWSATPPASRRAGRCRLRRGSISRGAPPTIRTGSWSMRPCGCRPPSPRTTSPPHRARTSHDGSGSPGGTGRGRWGSRAAPARATTSAACGVACCPSSPASAKTPSCWQRRAGSRRCGWRIAARRTRTWFRRSWSSRRGRGIGRSTSAFWPKQSALPNGATGFACCGRWARSPTQGCGVTPSSCRSATPSRRSRACRSSTARSSRISWRFARTPGSS